MKRGCGVPGIGREVLLESLVDLSPGRSTLSGVGKESNQMREYGPINSLDSSNSFEEFFYYMHHNVRRIG